MKKRTLPLLLLIVLFASNFSKTQAQCVLPEPYSGVVTGVNMTVMLTSPFIQSLPVSTESSYLLAFTQDGLVVASAYVSPDSLINNAQSVAVWGDDNFTPEIDGAVVGDTIIFQLVDGIDLYDVIGEYNIITNGYVLYVANGILVGQSSESVLNCTYNAEIGCMEESACNYNPLANSPGDCTFADDLCESCENGLIVDNDADDDGVCDADEVSGCQDSTACTYNPFATNPPIPMPGDYNPSECAYIDGICESCEEGQIVNDEFVPGQIIDNDSDNDGICNEDEIAGCQDDTACNYNDLATDDDGSCEFALTFYNCAGDCLSDIDGDEVCDQLEVLGCTDDAYMEYDSLATENNGSCVTLIIEGCMDNLYVEYNPEANIDIDPSYCITMIVEGCTDDLACNYDSEANTEDSSCEYVDGICESCEEGQIVNNDSDNDDVCNEDEIEGCQDDTACNYNALATDPATCTYLDGVCELCINGEVVANDDDEDALCNQFEMDGCTNPIACNYNSAATDDDSSCEFAATFYNCAGDCLSDIDADEVCDQLEVLGCTDDAYMEYDLSATENNGSCITLIVEGCMDDLYLEYMPEANVDTDPSSCITMIVEGCTDDLACNYNSEANTEDSSCEYAEQYYNCDGACVNDSDLDGVCDELEPIEGCTNETALNYDAEATADDGSCMQEITVTFETVTSITDVSSIYNIYIVNLYLGITEITIGDLIGVFYILDEELICGGYIVYDGSSPVEIAIVGDDSTTSEVEGFTEGQEIIWIVQQTSTETNYLIDVITEAEVFTPNTEEEVILEEVNPTVVLGCTDPIACNYNPDANLEDGICKYPDQYLDCFGNCINDFDGDGECDEVDYDDGIGLEELVEVPMSIYPNPSSDYINIDFESNLSNVKLELLNAIGDVVLIKTVDKIAANNTIQIAVSEMPDGLYFLKVTVDTQEYSLPWVKK